MKSKTSLGPQFKDKLLSVRARNNNGLNRESVIMYPAIMVGDLDLPCAQCTKTTGCRPSRSGSSDDLKDEAGEESPRLEPDSAESKESGVPARNMGG